IREAADPAHSTKERGKMVRELASREHTDPFGRRVRISRQTLDRWIRRIIPTHTTYPASPECLRPAHSPSDFRVRTIIFETTDAWPPRMADAVVRHAAWCRPGYGPANVLGLALTPS